MGLFDKKTFAPPTTPKQTVSKIESVKCPWCGKPNDMRGLQASMLIDRVNIEPTTLIHAKQHPTKRNPVSKEIKR
jgi:hypothetical protein